MDTAGYGGPNEPLQAFRASHKHLLAPEPDGSHSVASKPTDSASTISISMGLTPCLGALPWAAMRTRRSAEGMPQLAPRWPLLDEASLDSVDYHEAGHAAVAYLMG